MQTSFPSSRQGLKSKLRSPLFVGMTWFICSFLVSEGASQLAYRTLDYTPELAIPLFKVSRFAEFPAFYVYNSVLHDKVQTQLDKYYRENPGDTELSNFGDKVEDLANSEVYDLKDELNEAGYPAYISEEEYYAIRLGSCAFTGFILSLLVMLIFGRGSGQTIDRD